MCKMFIPYYINQDRLFDLYSILNDGYSEYEEITIDTSKDSSARAKLGGGIKFVKIEAETVGEKGEKSGKKEKKVQTIASMLSLVLEQLKKEKYITEINDARAGSFVCLPVTMEMNSLNDFMYETFKMIELTKKIQKIGENGQRKKDNSLNTVGKQIRDFIDITKSTESGKELLYNSEKFALVGNYYDEYLYRTTRNGIVGKEMMCFAQISRKHENGAHLLQNSVFSKMKAEEVEEFFKELGSVKDNDIYKYDTAVISKIEGKAVYEIEIIALFQQEL